MTLFNLYFMALIQNHIVFKVFLWICLLLLAVYIVFIEFKIFKKDKQLDKNIEDNEKITKEKKQLTFYERKAKTLIYLLVAITIITIVLTFTY